MLGDTAQVSDKKKFPLSSKEFQGEVIFPPSHIIWPEDGEFWNQNSYSAAMGESLPLFGFN